MSTQAKPRFSDIPQFPQSYYASDVAWDMLEDYIARIEAAYGLDFNPEFQRVHVWTPAQQTAFVEYGLRGGEYGRPVYFNHPEWGTGTGGPMVCVDGKQRIEAVRAFLRDEVPAFGHLHSQYADKLSMSGPSFRWHVAKLQTRGDVLRWYLAVNRGGTPHTAEEIARVEALLADEEKNPSAPLAKFRRKK